MQNFGTLRQPLLGELAMSLKKEEKKMPFIVATYVYACSLRAAHALRSDQIFCPMPFKSNLGTNGFRHQTLKVRYSIGICTVKFIIMFYHISNVEAVYLFALLK